jgi:predicted TIM-barrel fold metal-dependent hydrolase
MDRREFLKMSGKAIAAVSAMSMVASGVSGCDTSDYRVDVHHHIVPEEYVSALESIGINDSMGKPFPSWTPSDSLNLMNSLQVGVAVTSLSTPGVYFPEAPFSSEFERKRFAVNLARRCNEISAQMAVDYPGRFKFFATAPMPLVAESLMEVEYAFDRLGAAGVCLFANNQGKFLGHPDFNELMQELNRRKAIVFVHPSPPAGTSEGLGIDLEDFFVEAPADTTRAVVNMLVTGTLHRYPDIKWVLSHAGGVLPYIAWRLSLMAAYPEKLVNMPLGVLTYLKRLYYDTALSPSAYAMNSLTSLVEKSHILFGLDWPFSPTAAAVLQVGELNARSCFNETERMMVYRTNAVNLFQNIA